MMCEDYDLVVYYDEKSNKLVVKGYIKPIYLFKGEDDE